MRRVTLPRYQALRRHWAQHPRPEWLIAGYLGFKPRAEPIARVVRPGSRARAAPPTGALQTLFTQFGGAPGKLAVISA